ncbi:MAG: ATP-binding cassette domain-containing protein [Chloroflexota bacterium]|nr:ATP-binding cassette domain-containing protein [Chloroflexota bacterium]
MALATGVDLAKGFGAEKIFQGVSFEIQDRDRIAMVGVNGSGKSTLLKIIASLERPDRGAVGFATSVRVGYLPQEVSFPPRQTLQEYMLGAFGRLLEIEQELRAIEEALSAGRQDESVATLTERHGHLLHEYEDNGGYTYHSRIREVLAGLEIGEERLEQTLDSFSGGQRTRAALARLLLSEQDLLLLDEPTNHLDLAATEWLETFLAQARVAAVVVSHDRYFLDKVAVRTWEMSDGHLEAYAGNYTRFAEQKAERLARQEKEYEAQQEHIARTESFIRRYKAGQRARQARGRQKQLDRLERVGRPRDQAPMRVEIQSTLRSGDTVLAAEDLVVAAGMPAPSQRHASGGMVDKTAPALRVSTGQPVVYAAPRGRAVAPESLLFRAPDVEIMRGDRVAVVGPNGSGKTTFLRVVTGEAEPAGGRVYLGYGVQVAYYAQAHEQLNPKLTALDEIQATRPLNEEGARNYLGQFLFSGDDVFKPVSSLSGGERSRLALAKMALGNANFLVLDEPTNHLDIYARAALENVLASYNGTILFVSHDRYLIEALATHVWEVSHGQLTTHGGGWTDYLAARERQQIARRNGSAGPRSGAHGANGAHLSLPPSPASSPAKGSRQRTKEVTAQRERLTRLEAEIRSAQERLQGLSAQLEAASGTGDAAQITDLGRQHVAASETLALHEEEWLALCEDLETAPAGVS